MPNRAPIDWNYHRGWWPGALADPRRRMMILEENETPVAIVIFLEVERGGSSTWGYYTAPRSEITASRARAAWIACQFLGTNYAFRHLHLETLVCNVVQSNTGVLRLHERTGFKLVGSRLSGDERPPFATLQLERSCWDNGWARPFFDDFGAMTIVPDPRDSKFTPTGTLTAAG